MKRDPDISNAEWASAKVATDQNQPERVRNDAAGAAAQYAKEKGKKPPNPFKNKK